MTEMRTIRKLTGNFLEDFRPGNVFRHKGGKTVTEGLFTTFTEFAMTSNPLAKNARYARTYGFEGLVCPPGLTMLICFSQTVEDVSENARANLEYIEMRVGAPLYVGDTAEVETKVLNDMGEVVPVHVPIPVSDDAPIIRLQLLHDGLGEIDSEELEPQADDRYEARLESGRADPARYEPGSYQIVAEWTSNYNSEVFRLIEQRDIQNVEMVLAERFDWQIVLFREGIWIVQWIAELRGVESPHQRRHVAEGHGERVVSRKIKTGPVGIDDHQLDIGAFCNHRL